LARSKPSVVSAPLARARPTIVGDMPARKRQIRKWDSAVRFWQSTTVRGGGGWAGRGSGGVVVGAYLPSRSRQSRGSRCQARPPSRSGRSSAPAVVWSCGNGRVWGVERGQRSTAGSSRHAIPFASVCIATTVPQMKRRTNNNGRAPLRPQGPAPRTGSLANILEGPGLAAAIGIARSRQHAIQAENNSTESH